mmetsp:Transcript_58869/g.137528  ORF Transcript_58869/g.137528 Transcript_58869/m.137528 type:complete len:573 (+) Transcript_58869:109-1827(+)
MVWRLDLTGEVIPVGTDKEQQSWACLSVDEDGMLTFNYEVLETIMGKLVRAVNMLSEQVGTLQTDLEETHGSVEHLEKQLASDMAKADDAMGQVRELQVKMMSMDSFRPASAPSDALQRHGTADIPSAESPEYINPATVLEKVEDLANDVEGLLEMQDAFAKYDIAERMDKFEELIQSYEDTVLPDFRARLAYNETMLLQLRADIDKLAQQFAEDERNKASSAALEALTARFEALRRERQKDRSMLEGATDKFEKLDELYETVTRNTSRLQELWKNVKGESQEFRSWTCRALDDIRSSMRNKLDEHNASKIQEAMRRELHESIPKISQVVSVRLEPDLQNKAGLAEFRRLQEIVDTLAQPSHKGQLLMGTKCLTCNRPVTTQDASDIGCHDVPRAKHEEGLLKDVQRALLRQQEEPGVDETTLNYVAVRLGSPERAVQDGRVFETRVKDNGAGEFSLTRIVKPNRPTGGGPATNEARKSVGVEVTASTRSPKRDMPPMVRVGPRRIKKLLPPGTGTAVPQSPRYGASMYSADSERDTADVSGAQTSVVLNSPPAAGAAQDSQELEQDTEQGL